MLALQFRQPAGAWVDQHLRPNTWCLTASLPPEAPPPPLETCTPRQADCAHGVAPRPFDFDFIGRVESFCADLAALDAALARRTGSDRWNLRAECASQVGNTHWRHAARFENTAFVARLAARALSDEAVRAMCAHPAYAAEWAALGYTRPAACAGAPPPPANTSRRRDM